MQAGGLVDDPDVAELDSLDTLTADDGDPDDDGDEPLVRLESLLALDSDSEEPDDKLEAVETELNDESELADELEGEDPLVRLDSLLALLLDAELPDVTDEVDVSDVSDDWDDVLDLLPLLLWEMLGSDDGSRNSEKLTGPV